MKTGTRLLVAASLIVTGIALPVIASGDAHENGARDACAACEKGCRCQVGDDQGRMGSGEFTVRMQLDPTGQKRRERDGRHESEKKSHDEESPRARAERLGLWLHDWAEKHPVLAKRGSKLVLTRELHPKRFLKALDDLPGPARRELIRAMDRLAQYERLLGKHPDDYRDFVHEHFPKRFDHMMRLWASAGHDGEGRQEDRGDERREHAGKAERRQGPAILELRPLRRQPNPRADERAGHDRPEHDGDEVGPPDDEADEDGDTMRPGDEDENEDNETGREGAI